MDNCEAFIVSSEAVEKYMDNCEKILAGYLASLEHIEGLQDLININTALSQGYIAALEELKAGEVPKH